MGELRGELTKRSGFRRCRAAPVPRSNSESNPPLDVFPVALGADRFRSTRPRANAAGRTASSTAKQTSAIRTSTVEWRGKDGCRSHARHVEHVPSAHGVTDTPVVRGNAGPVFGRFAIDHPESAPRSTGAFTLSVGSGTSDGRSPERTRAPRSRNGRPTCT
ncbi:hypothetical protein P3102_09110 [Amycolatopsis sp. QT-25]|uniref:hypothetical protein n=1 Tax=Amycolatopsis sp. QT-25 TaxID=3034022 RepID=UPI0023EB6C7B|nr:hypothetical protein [Amycolatopsis sp. QT-25]WET81355.1 hypothetical protein P3102_09110 [Amycolatopsis sp. QT-25]